MPEDVTPATPVSLLERLRHPGASAKDWDDFVERYGRLLFRWCRQWGVSYADAQDVTQDAFLAVVRQIAAFQYDANGSFRAWLKTIAYRCWVRVLEDHARQAKQDEAAAQLSSVEAREDLLNQFIAAARQEVLEVAMERVRQRVQPTTWEAFRLTALEDVAGEEVARRLKIQVGAVYMARSRVQRLIREEVATIDADA